MPEPVLQKLASGPQIFRQLVPAPDASAWASELLLDSGWRKLLLVALFGPNPLYLDVPITDSRLTTALRSVCLAPIKTAYATRYVTGDKLTRHSDAVHGHPRLVLLLRKPENGGVLVIEDRPYDVDVGDAILHDGKGFHEVTRVEAGERMSLLAEVVSV